MIKITWKRFFDTLALSISHLFDIFSISSENPLEGQKIKVFPNVRDKKNIYIESKYTRNLYMNFKKCFHIRFKQIYMFIKKCNVSKNNSTYLS